jgi:hypothetical protein
MAVKMNKAADTLCDRGIIDHLRCLADHLASSRTATKGSRAGESG